MEWSGEQQIQFWLQSVVLGAIQGLLLDVLTALAQSSCRKRWLWTDVVFGPLAAVVTFFGALVIMDGQLHPLLFVGVVSGMVLEHWTVGGMLCRCICCIRRYMRRWMACLRRGGYVAITFLRCIGKKRKNNEKPHILSAIFSKNS